MHSLQRSLWFSLLVLLTAFAVLPAAAQIGGSGSIQGTISDSTGAAVAGATVTATNIGTNARTTQPTSSAGFYSLAALPPGTYTVSVAAQGFQKLSQEHIVVDALAIATVNLTLTIGAATDVITVTEAPPQIETSNATLGSVMRNEQYNALPLAMNAGPRDPTAFVALVPGVQALSSQAAGSSFATFNGGQPYMNEVYVEGIPMTNASAQGETRNLAYSVSVEAVDQFQVQTNSSPAEYQGQGIENFTIRSGSNRFHGAAYEYFRNTVLDARGYFPTFRPPEKQNQFGGRVGGYIIKDKLFFFGNYDGYRYRAASNPTLQFVPTAAMLRGDFSALPQRIYDPLSTVCNPTCTRTAFPNNIIPASRLSAVSASLASYLPQVANPNAIGPNYVTVLPIGLNNNSTTDRVDWTINQKQRIYFIFSMGKYVTVPFAGISANTSALPLPYAATRVVTEKPLTGQIHHIYTITPNLLNQFGYSYARLAIPITSATSAGQYPTKAGLAGLPAGQASNAFPTVNFAGTNAPQSWAGTNSQAFDEVANTYVVQDNVQWVKGKHSLTAGGQVSWLQDNFTSPDDRSNATFNFANSETASYLANGNIDNTSGNAFASYLLGANDSASVNDNSVVTTGARYFDLAFYAQDDYRVTDKLTLNLGLRYDILGTFHEALNRMSFLNPTLANPAAGNRPGALQFAGNGTDSCNCATPVKTYYGAIGPRISLAYAATPKTAIRAGFAIMYAHGNGTSGRGGGRNGLGQLGYNATPSFNSVLGNGAPAFFWSNVGTLPAAYASTVTQGGLPAYQKAPFFDPSLNTGYCSGDGCLPAGGSITYGDPNIGGRPPAFNNYTFSIQQVFTPTLTMTFAYTGSQGHYLPTSSGRPAFSNQIDPRYLALGRNTNNLLKGNDLNTLVTAPGAIAAYNADAAALGLPAYQAPFANYNNTFGRALFPFPQYNAVTDIWGGIGNSSYNAIEIIANQRATNSLTFQIAYTLSKEIDDVVGTARTAYNNRLERSLGNIDRKHLITSSGVWTLPLGKGHRWANQGIASALAGGFEISSIFTLSSGAPLAITSTSCNIPFTGGLCVPNINPNFTGSPSINGGLSSGNGNTQSASHNISYINANAFAKVPAYTFGNVTHNAPYGLRSPFTWDQDLTVRRTFSVWEDLKLQAAVSAFNIYNTVNFGGVTTNFDSSAFGTVTNQANAPRKLQAEARITF